ncbi:hypothetical protein CCHR01_17135 [Colletotrichum chrysophilum]|uniref:Uncharacterized protein n=1 Tax=Colletotrichum chrysophilum TaxID=1836956 RepID=A0AAD9E9U1_9PEZI|nr:hypothetical protein CCHR01_17135 [Colletotrichum chrysophilum]
MNCFLDQEFDENQKFSPLNNRLRSIDVVGFVETIDEDEGHRKTLEQIVNQALNFGRTYPNGNERLYRRRKFTNGQSLQDTEKLRSQVPK